MPRAAAARPTTARSTPREVRPLVNFHLANLCVYALG
jgi:hypothetical protein